MTLPDYNPLVKELFPTMKILLFGHRGQVGNALQKTLPSDFHLFHSDIDITEPPSLQNEILRIHPDIIINAAAYTHVDNAEMDKDTAYEVNGISPLRMAEWAKKINALLVHYSTDYVFDGDGFAPWTEDDTPSPINTYGSTKLEGDNHIIKSGCRYLIIRTSWVYGEAGNNFIKSICQQAKIKDNISVVCDQIGVPTSATFLAQTTYKMIEETIRNERLIGLYNVVPRGETSWANYAELIIKKLELSSSIHITPVLSKDYPQIAKRPLNSRLNTEKLQKNFSFHLPDWKEDVIKFLQHQDIKNEI